MPESTRDIVGQLIDRRYRVEASLGSGGMGSVWRVQHVESLQRFALKTLEAGLSNSKAARDRLLREARAAAALRTRHVVKVVDAHMEYHHGQEPLPFLVMELLEGSNLEQWIELGGSLAPGQAIWLARQLGMALALAHEQGIVHRDLKPSNVFLAHDEDGGTVVKLCDFGIAKLMEAADELSTNLSGVTQTGELLGTPLYLAPEILRGAAQAVPATDQWALGLTLFRALTGREYFRATSSTDLVLRIAQDPMMAPSELAPELPNGFDAWFFKACARDPGQRFTDVPSQVAALHRALGAPEPQAIDLRGRELAAQVATLAALDDQASDAGAAAPVFDGVDPPPVDAPPSRSRAKALAHQAFLVFGIGWALAITAWFVSSNRGVAALGGTEPNPSAEGAEAVGDMANLADTINATTTRPPTAPDAPPEPPSRRSQATSAPPSPPRQTAPEPTHPATPTQPPSRAPKQTRSMAPAKVTPTTSTSRGKSPDTQTRRRGPGESCVRSSQCSSGLCVAERCR